MAAIGFAVAGAVVASRRRANPIGWIFVALGLTGGLNLAAIEYGVYALASHPGSLPGGSIGLWVAHWAFPLSALLLVVLLLFPDGKVLSNRWRPVLAVAAALPVVFAAGYAVGPGPLNEPQPDSFPDLRNPFGLAHLQGLIHGGGAIFAPLLLFTIVAAVASLVLRFRHATGRVRYQLKWITYAAAVMATLFVVVGILSWIDVAGPVILQIGSPIAIALFILAMAIALLRYRLYDIDLIINRTLVYLALTGSLVGVYAGTVAALSGLFRSADLGASVVAAAAVAVLFAPLRLRLQRGVDRLLYGRRSDPYGVISLLAERLQEAVDADGVLPSLADSIAEALKLPYAAIELADGDGFRVAAAYGHLAGEPLRLPLSYQNQVVGRLLLGPRTPGETFSRADLRVFGDIARQAGVAAYAVRLTTDLQRSRQRLVAAREEERRRIRRDLHDGLGPLLAGVSLQLDTARSLLRSDPSGADALLERLIGETQSAIADIRRLVYDLRPPALDELGLVGALRQQAARLGSTGIAQGGAPLSVFVEAPEDLNGLPAAVEVAAYRIATEAMTNVARHARARSCTLRISLGDAMELEVLDDGQGLPPRRPAGVGLASMRQRAAELGGTCTIAPAPAGGTMVVARFPLPEA
jgi:signal transduction histidine kinase